MKSAFGTIIGTVVQQQDEITHMTHQMQKNAEENAQQQRSIVVFPIFNFLLYIVLYFYLY